jgi:hypothetical protein
LWYSKYRALLGNQDRNNLVFYQKKFDFRISDESNLVDLIGKHKEQISGLVIWDKDFDDTVNISSMLAAQENLSPVTSQLMDQISDLGLPVKLDLRTRWKNRVELYRWA